VLRIPPLPAAIVAGVFAVALWEGAGGAPRRAVHVGASSWQPEHAIVRGAFHVHTRRSDGAGAVVDVAAAAARTGLDFVVVTDHGDGVRPPDPPAYHHGVLAIDAVEISTTGGHYVALDLPAAPYPLGGDPRGLVEDVARLGGFGVVAHPASPKRSQAWEDWSLEFDAIEWINADSEWRDEHGFRLMTAAASYFWRGPESIAALFDRPAAVLSRFDRLTSRRRVLAFAGHDAHGRVAFGGHGQAIRDWAGAPLPSYDSVFGTFSLHVELEDGLSGAVRDDSRRILDAIRGGRFFTAVDALAAPARFDFHGERDGRRVAMGGALWERAEEPTGPRGAAARLRTRVVGPAGASLVLLRNGREVASSGSGEIDRSVPFEDAVYRVEVRIPGAPGSPPTPWIVSNPIWTRLPTEGARRSDRGEILAVADTSDASGWLVESDPDSQASVESAKTSRGTEIAFRYGLAAGARRGQWAALLRPTGDVRGATHVTFRVRASAPSRLWVQLRPAWPDARRWRHSLYADEQPRRVVLPLSEWTPLRLADRVPPAAADVDQILFVVDTTNTPPGTARSFFLDELRFERRG
jgi:hypothetical protein